MREVCLRIIDVGVTFRKSQTRHHDLGTLYYTPHERPTIGVGHMSAFYSPTTSHDIVPRKFRKRGSARLGSDDPDRRHGSGRPMRMEPRHSTVTAREPVNRRLDHPLIPPRVLASEDSTSTDKNE